MAGFCPRVRAVWEARCLLGEGPVWCAATGSLYFVDIKGKQLLRWSECAEGERFALASETGAIALSATGGFVAAQKAGFTMLKLDPWTETPLAMPGPIRPGNRFNDGKCDAAGRFWAASMDDACREPTGEIWSLSPDGRMRRHVGGFVVGNGFGWSRDNRTMYFTDSANRRILAYEFDLTDGRLGSCRCFATIPPDAGFPDGLVVDADDHVWSAQWDGWRITRYRPDGIIERVIEMPVPRPTSLAFGGDDLRTLYVTSARIDLNDDQLSEAPSSGALLALETGIRGVPLPQFGQHPLT